jgi:uncharacterized protein YjbJ (UPF0337 family)
MRAIPQQGSADTAEVTVDFELYAVKSRKDHICSPSAARVGRVDPQSLFPIEHRSTEVRQDLVALRARDALVAVRTELINTARGLVKGLGGRLPKCSSQSFPHKVEDVLPAKVGGVKVGGGSKDGGWVYTDPEAGSQNGNSGLEESFRKEKGRKPMKPSTKDQLKGTAHEVKGKIKEKAGQVTNDPKLKAKGQAENLAGKVQKKVGQIEKVFEK